jgi:hypothetical protein
MSLCDRVAGPARCPCVKWETGGGECGGTAQRVKARTRRSHYCFQLRFYFQQRCSFLTMSQSEPIPFRCPGCEAEYKLVTIEICEGVQGKLRCLKCDAMFPAGEGRVAFKYFLVGDQADAIEGNDRGRDFLSPLVTALEQTFHARYDPKSLSFLLCFVWLQGPALIWRRNNG